MLFVAPRPSGHQNRFGYVFTSPDVKERLRQTKGRSLLTWAIALQATPTEDMSFRQVIHEKYLEPLLTTQGHYKAHLENLARRILVRMIKSVSILLFAGELRKEDDNQLIRWMYRK